MYFKTYVLKMKLLIDVLEHVSKEHVKIYRFCYCVASSFLYYGVAILFRFLRLFMMTQELLGFVNIKEKGAK